MLHDIFHIHGAMSDGDGDGWPSGVLDGGRGEEQSEEDEGLAAAVLRLLLLLFVPPPPIGIAPADDLDNTGEHDGEGVDLAPSAGSGDFLQLKSSSVECRRAVAASELVSLLLLLLAGGEEDITTFDIACCCWDDISPPLLSTALWMTDISFILVAIPLRKGGVKYGKYRWWCSGRRGR